MKRILVCLPFAWAAHAATNYFCSCGAGADVACVNGADGNAGTSTASPKQTRSAITTVIQAAHAGDQILLCKGGAWDAWDLTAKATTDSLSAYQSAPLVIDSFSPTTFSSTAKPLLNLAAGGIGFNFESNDSWGTTRWGGYIISGLWIDGGSDANTQGFRLFRTPQNIVFNNLTISNVGTFGSCGGQGAWGYPSDFALKNSTLTYSLGNGIGIFGCDNTLIENNWFDHAAYAAKTTTLKERDHGAYVSGNDTVGRDTYGIVIRHNTFTNTGLGTTDIAGASTKCGTTVLVGHDQIRDAVIEGNTITQASGTVIGKCYGIQYSPGNGGSAVEYEKRLVIRGNRINNPGNIGIELAACQTCTVENNVIVKEEDWEITAIDVKASAFGTPPALANANVTVRNNSAYLYGDASTGSATGFSIGGNGTGHVVVNNMVVWGAGHTGARYCFEPGGLASSAFTAWDNNLCYGGNQWSSAYTTKANFTAGFGASADANGLSADPLLVATPASGNNYSMQLQSGSPAKNAGHATKGARLSIDGYPAIGTRDIGAFEFGSNP